MALAGERAVAVTTLSDTQNTVGTTSSTSYTSTLTGGTACAVVFVAPPSGSVIIFNNADMVNSGTGYNSCAIEVKTGGVVGSGITVVSPGFDNNILNNPGNVQIRGSVSQLIPGLTAGTTYNVRQRYLVSSGTMTINNKHLIVQPQL